jgi:16S rRNA (guanine(966)-N(2))-methyltransferase RsmD
MRIISGTLGGRRIQPPSNMPYTRPTTDMAKEGLFNIIQNYLDIPDLKTLDLFGGTGCISYELASRGATDLTVVEKDPKMVAFIKTTAEKLGILLNIINGDVFKYIAASTGKFDFIFAGPPYALGTIDELPVQIFKHSLLHAGGWFVLEHTPRNDYKNNENFMMERNYGTTIFTIFQNSEKKSVLIISSFYAKKRNQKFVQSKKKGIVGKGILR